MVSAAGRRNLKGGFAGHDDSRPEQFVRSLQQAHEVQVLFEGLSSYRQATSDTGAQTPQRSCLPMRGLRKDFQAWQTPKGDPRRSTTLRLKNRNPGNPLANFCDAGPLSVALKGWLSGIEAPYGRRKCLCHGAGALLRPEIAPRAVSQSSCGRKRLGTIARNAGERRAGDGLSRLAPAQTAQSRKTRAPLPGPVCRGEGRGGQGRTDSHALSNTWESVQNLDSVVTHGRENVRV